MNKQDFLNRIGLTEIYLIKFSINKNKCYKKFYIEKRSGGKRLIEAPNIELKGIQTWILNNLLINYPVHEYAMAYAKDKSIVKNAELHVGNKFIATLDLSDFFQSFKEESLFQLLIKDNDQRVALWVSKLCTLRGSLPQGAVTSPALSNILFYEIDQEISKQCSELGVVYTRYSDDMAFSSSNFDRVITARNQSTKIIEQYGFLINKKKGNLMSGRFARKVTGINVGYLTDKVTVNSQFKNLLRSLLYHYIIHNDLSLENKVLGMLSFTRSVNFRTYHYFQKYSQKLKERCK